MNQRQPAWTPSAVAWIAVLALMASFQLWRGALVDGTLFLGLVVVLIGDRITRGRVTILTRPPVASWRWVVVGAALAVITLALSPRHSTLSEVVVSCVGVAVIALAWAPTPSRREHPRAAYRRSAAVWSLAGVGFCLWEAAAYILSTNGFSETDFPTVSVLLNPLLELPVARAAVAALWMIAGLWFIRPRKPAR